MKELAVEQLKIWKSGTACMYMNQEKETDIASNADFVLQVLRWLLHGDALSAVGLDQGLAHYLTYTHLRTLKIVAYSGRMNAECKVWEETQGK